MTSYDRRSFALGTLALLSSALVTPVRSRAQAAAGAGERVPWADDPIIDCHFHPRMPIEANLRHLDGAGISHALILARSETIDEALAIRSGSPRRFKGWCSGVDVTRPDASALLTAARKAGGRCFGEIKSPAALAGPEFRRIYALAAELEVPIILHLEDTPGPVAAGFATGFANLEAMLKAFPRTRFVGHAQTFWANISADPRKETAYPTGPVRRGGLTDRLLSDYPNLFGDLSATSGNNALTRDPSFTSDFLDRHQDKLVFGSDCPCLDGRGTGNQGPLTGKCVARETLAVLQRSTSPAVFRKLTWSNGHRVYTLSS